MEELLKCIITVMVLLFLTIKFYLFVARKSDKHTRKEIWATAKFEIPIFIAIYTVLCGLEEGVTASKLYMYFLISLYAIMEGLDNYKVYKEIKKDESI